MTEQSMIFAMTDVTSADGVVHVGRHTSQIAFMNQGSDFVTIRLNGKFDIKIGHGQQEAHFYNIIDGDYPTFQVMTDGDTVSVYALG